MDILTLGKISAVKRETDKKIKDLDLVVTTALTATTDLVDTNIALAVTNLNTALTDTTATLNSSMDALNTSVTNTENTLNQTVTDGLSGMSTTLGNCNTCIRNDIGSDLTNAINGIPEGGMPGEHELMYYNRNSWSHSCGRGCSSNWTVPTGTTSIKFEIWGGGGSGAGHCCFQCYCDIASCGPQGGTYARKTLFQGQFTPGSTNYTFCMGNGGNGDGTCCTRCCDAPRGCASYVNGPGLSNFCAAGGRGGYNIYCTCRCNYQHCRNEHPRCLGMHHMGQPSTQTNDFSATAFGSGFLKFKGNHCDCAARMSCTSGSYGLRNEHSTHTEEGNNHRACWRDCCGRYLAAGGMNGLKSQCGHRCCYWGTYGKGGLVKISYTC